MACIWDRSGQARASNQNRKLVWSRQVDRVRGGGKVETGERFFPFPSRPFSCFCSPVGSQDRASVVFFSLFKNLKRLASLFHGPSSLIHFGNQKGTGRAEWDGIMGLRVFLSLFSKINKEKKLRKTKMQFTINVCLFDVTVLFIHRRRLACICLISNLGLPSVQFLVMHKSE